MHTSSGNYDNSRKWKVLMVDDEPQVHRTTRMVLSDFTYKNIGLELFEACSAHHAAEIIRKEKNIAIILLDVVMETDEAGLEFVDYVRNVLKNNIVQIILKTGQPGRFPEKEVVSGFNINNFFSKTELTADRMNTMITSALRGYELSSSLKYLNIRLQKELERKRAAEEALKKSESKIRNLSQLQQNIIDSTDIWLHVKNRAGEIIIWNEAAESISGYTREEVSAKKNIWNRIIPFENERQRLCHEESLIISDKNEPFDFETTIINKKGFEKTLSWHLRPLKNEDGSVFGISYLGVDITEKKIMEKKFFHSQKMEAVGRLAGGVAHDFNNTLTVIRGYCELLQIKVKDDENLYKNVVQIDRAAEKAELLTRQLLSFSRHQMVKTEVFDINELVLNMKNMLSRLVNENITIRTDLESQKLYIRNNRGKVEQALMNLVVNAVDAMPEGGEILISTKVKSYSRKNSVLLIVSDTGSGIPKDIQPHVFDPFFTTKSRDKGTGLGLSTVYGIMKQCKGSVYLKSEEGKGTRIYLSFPCVEADCICENIQVKNNGLKNQESRATNILIAEENKDVLEALSEMLENEGYSTVSYDFQDKSFDFGKYKNIDLLVTEFIMSGMNGPELYERLSCINPGLKVVYTSGYSEESIPKKSDIHIFLEKPFTSPTLFSAVDELLSQKSMM